LIAVAVALTTQCPYCIDIHAGNARKPGATDVELTGAAMIAAPCVRGRLHPCDPRADRLNAGQRLRATDRAGWGVNSFLRRAKTVMDRGFRGEAN
jgi:AhpD family alkylhydroperoxidase